MWSLQRRKVVDKSSSYCLNQAIKVKIIHDGTFWQHVPPDTLRRTRSVIAKVVQIKSNYEKIIRQIQIGIFVQIKKKTWPSKLDFDSSKMLILWKVKKPWKTFLV